MSENKGCMKCYRCKAVYPKAVESCMLCNTSNFLLNGFVPEEHDFNVNPKLLKEAAEAVGFTPTESWENDLLDLVVAIMQTAEDCGCHPATKLEEMMREDLDEDDFIESHPNIHQQLKRCAIRQKGYWSLDADFVNCDGDSPNWADKFVVNLTQEQVKTLLKTQALIDGDNGLDHVAVSLKGGVDKLCLLDIKGREVEAELDQIELVVSANVIYLRCVANESENYESFTVAFNGDMFFPEINIVPKINIMQSEDDKVFTVTGENLPFEMTYDVHVFDTYGIEEYEEGKNLESCPFKNISLDGDALGLANVVKSGVVRNNVLKKTPYKPE